MPGSREAIAQLSKSGHEIYIISNQAGIGRGLMREGDLFEIHKRMEKEIEKHGGKLGGIYYCMHGWDDNCLCRKPKPGMLFRAAIDHQIELANTVFVGDDKRDIQAGAVAGCRTVLMKPNGNLLEVINKFINKTNGSR